MTTVRRGLDSQGYIERDGSLGRIQDTFRPVVAAARDRVADVFGKRLDSAYLYGSVPRGTARVHRSDLDLLLVLREEPGAADRADARAVAAAVDKEFAEVDGVGVLLLSRARVLSDHETYDHGWFLACLCTPLLGEDLAEFLPRYRPDARLARQTNGDLAALLPPWRERLGAAVAAGDDAALRALCRTVSRRLVRTGFTLVMPLWNGWTGELDEMAEVFGRYCPEWADRMRAAAAVAYEPVADPAVLRELTDVLGPWLAREHTARHGVRTPGPWG